MDASKHIDQKIASLSDWRGELLRSLRQLIHEVDPTVVEEWKWMGTPVWNRDGIICLANAHTSKVKVTFPKGAKLSDPQRVFNAELAGNAWRAIDWSQGDAINVDGLKGLVRAAIALNRSKPATRKPDATSSVSAKRPGTKQPTAKQPAAKQATAKQPAAKATANKPAPAKPTTKQPAAKATAKKQAPKATAKKPAAKPTAKKPAPNAAAKKRS
jgi:hypothetical protein